MRIDYGKCASTKASSFRKVLKVVRLGEMDAEQSVDSKNEAELLAELNHEHIVKVGIFIDR